MKRMTVILALATVAALAASPLLASGVPSEITIQGRLADASNNIVIDGVYAITFKIYSDSTGGTALWTETQPVQVTRGLFAAQLGHSTALPVDLFASGAEYYLGITVNLESELPRIPLSSVAYSYQSKDADVALLAMDLSCAGCVSAGEIAADAVGAAEIAAGAVVGGLGGDIADGSITADDLGSNSVGADEIATDAVGAAEIAANAVGASEIATGAVVGGPGGDVADASITADDLGTNSVGVDEIAANGVGAVEILAGAVGTSEVADGSLTAVDIDDEPGVASNTGTSSIALDGTNQTLLLRSIIAPAAGYVLVIATGQVLIGHTNGSASGANFGVSSTAGVFPSNQNVAVQISGAAPSGSYYQAVTVHGLFSTPGGADTFYFLGDEGGGDFSAGDLQLTLIYFPTAHGTVVSTAAASGADIPDE